jgi:nucleoside-diphosphate-sugar epimerase
MRTLVTGGAGFIGSALSRALLDQGHEVRIIDNLSTGSAANLPPGAEFVEGDIRDLPVVEKACRGIDVVYHEAAFKSVPKSIQNPLAAETTNAVGSINVLTASARSGVERVVYASSSSVYGDSDGIKVESQGTNPISPYGVSKLTGEHYCRVWARTTDLVTVCLRYFNVFGPGQRADSQYAAVLPAFVSALGKGKPATIYGDGNQTRDFTFVDDVVRANLLVLSASPELAGAVMNICAGAPKTVNQLFKEVCNAMDVWVEPKFVPHRPGDILHSHGDISRARELIGWAPQADWSQAIAATVEWFRSDPGALSPPGD